MAASKAKKLPFPKPPKANASLATWENYKKRCEVVVKKRATVAADKKKKATIKEQVKVYKQKNK